MNGTVNRRKLRVRRTLAVAAAVIFALAAALAFYFRDRIASDPVSGADAWRIEAGSSAVYGVCGNSLVSASSTGVQVFDKNGAELASGSFSMANPSLCCADSLAAVWDTGGTELRVTDAKGAVTAIEPTGEITCVTVSDSGHVAVLAAQTGWKGVVTVYDKSLTAVYKWYSGTDYPIAAEVSPDGERLAVITASPEGGRVRVFALGLETELGNYLSEGALFTGLGWISRTELCAVTASAAVFINGEAEETGSFDFGGLRVGGLSFGGDGFVTVALAKYLSGEPNVVVTLGASGQELGRLETENGVACIDARGSRVLCLSDGGVTLYSSSLARRSAADAPGASSALLTDSGSAIIIGGEGEVSLIRF